MDYRVWQAQVANEGRQQQKESGNDQRNDRRGVHPIQPLPLRERYIEQRKPEAHVEKSLPARFGLSLLGFWKRLPRDAKVNQHHHDWCEYRGVPEDPMPCQVIHVPGFEGSCDVQRNDNIHGVHGDPKQARFWASICTRLLASAACARSRSA